MAKQNRVTTGTQLARECWDLLRQNREWMKIPLLSAVGVAIVTVIFGVVALIGALIFAPFSNADSPNTIQNGLGLILLFLYYFATYSIR